MANEADRSVVLALLQVAFVGKCNGQGLAPRISQAVSVTAVLKLINESMTASSLFMMMRCKLPAYHSLEGFQHIAIFQLFKVKLESCVFWLAYLSHQTRIS